MLIPSLFTGARFSFISLLGISPELPFFFFSLDFYFISLSKARGNLETKQHSISGILAEFEFVDTFAWHGTKRVFSAWVWMHFNHVAMVLCLPNSVLVQKGFSPPRLLCRNMWNVLPVRNLLVQEFLYHFAFFRQNLLLKMQCVLLNHYHWQRCTRKGDLSVSSEIPSRVCMESSTVFIKSVCLIWKSWEKNKHRILSHHVFFKTKSLSLV